MLEESTVRACDGCVLCCKLLAFREAKTPAGSWCTHCSYSGEKGCRRYGDGMPAGCADFACIWSQGFGSRDYRPDKIHAVMDVAHNETLGEDVLYVTEGAPNAFRHSAVQEQILLHLTRQNMFVIIVQARGSAFVLVPSGKKLPPQAELGNGIEVRTFKELFPLKLLRLRRA